MNTLRGGILRDPGFLPLGSALAAMLVLPLATSVLLLPALAPGLSALDSNCL